MQVEQAFHRIRPLQAALPWNEERIRVIDVVNRDARRFERILDPLQGRIELPDEIKVDPRVSGMQRDVEVGRADEVEIREVVLRPEHPANGKPREVEFFQTCKVGFRGSRLTRPIGIAGRRPGAVGRCDQPDKFLLREPAQAKPAVRPAFNQAAQTPQHIRHRRIGVSRSSGQPVGRYKMTVGQPMVQEDFPNHK